MLRAPSNGWSSNHAHTSGGRGRGAAAASRTPALPVLCKDQGTAWHVAVLSGLRRLAVDFGLLLQD